MKKVAHLYKKAGIVSPAPFKAQVVNFQAYCELRQKRISEIPLGIIELSREGIIKSHNPPNWYSGPSVVGLNLFDDIAPCKRLRPTFELFLQEKMVCGTTRSIPGALFIFSKVGDSIVLIVEREGGER